MEGDDDDEDNDVDQQEPSQLYIEASYNCLLL